MFGYVNVYKDELKIKDYNTYKAYYCGLCKAIGKKHNQILRMCLNYDFTFLALLLDSLYDEKSKFDYSGCIKKMGKKKIITACNAIDFASDMNVIFAYYKLKDDVKDNHSIKSFICLLPFLRRVRIIRKKYPQLCKKISDCLLRLSFLEENGCEYTDKLSHEFGTILKAMFEEISSDESISRFGYQLGRLIYTMDACDDIVSDYKTKSYNPVIIQNCYEGIYTPVIKKSIADSLYMTMAELADIYDTLDIKKNKEVLDNIIYLGMRAKCDMIINQCNNRKENKHEKPL